jgi:ribosomal protein S11
LALVDVEAADAAAAVAAAWESYRPGAHRPLKIAMASAPRDGWEKLHVYVYETSPNEKAAVYALACRAGQNWTVAIVEASDSTYEKRSGKRDGKQALIIHDAKHEYAFIATSP